MAAPERLLDNVPSRAPGRADHQYFHESASLIIATSLSRCAAVGDHGVARPASLALSGGGEGVGLMPSMDEVLREFPDQAFLINVKSIDRAEGERLASVLNDLSAERRATLMVYAGVLRNCC